MATLQAYRFCVYDYHEMGCQKTSEDHDLATRKRVSS